MKQLVDIGNPDAPEGSEPWCRAFHLSLCRLKREGEFAVSNLKYSLREFHEHEYFKTLINEAGKPFKNWRTFVQAREPFGLDMSADVVKAIMGEQDDKKLLKDVLGKHGGDRRSEKAKDQGDNITLKERGTSRAYILARLDRDGHTELAAEVRAGTLSANAAAIEAGFRTKSTPLDTVLALLPKLTAAGRAKVRAALAQAEDRAA